MKFNVFLTNTKLTDVKQAFDVKNEAGELVYKIRGNSLMMGAKVSLLDEDDNELLFIKQKVSLTHSFDIIENGQKIANIKKKMVALTPKFKISELNWRVSGKIFSREYQLLDDKGNVVAIIDRSGLFEDMVYSFELVDEQVNPILPLAIVTCIDVFRMQ